MSEANPSPLHSGLRLGFIALLCLTLIAGVRAVTAERIAAQEMHHAQQILAAVLGPGDWEISSSQQTVASSGSEAPAAWRYTGPASGRLTRHIALDGYNGAIHFWLGQDDDGTLRGVRIITHRETPGLTDDLNWPASSWIEGFTEIPPDSNRRFDVVPHRGDFEAFTGATVTPRAIVRAVGRTRALHPGVSDTVRGPRR